MFGPEIGTPAWAGVENRLKTVESHLAAVYRKLGISGRGQLTAALEG